MNKNQKNNKIKKRIEIKDNLGNTIKTFYYYED